MASAPARPPQVDTSPEAIAARRVNAEFARQDEALRMKEEGAKPVEIGRAMGVATHFAHSMIGAAAHRREAMRQAAEPCDLEALALTEPERALIEALTLEHFDLWAETAVRSPTTRSVAWYARRSHGWVSSTARRRIDEQVNPPKGTPKGRYGVELVPGLGLVRIAGNGYVNLTAKGWSTARALLPHRFPA